MFNVAALWYNYYMEAIPPTGMILDSGSSGSSIMEGGRASGSAPGYLDYYPGMVCNIKLIFYRDKRQVEFTLTNQALNIQLRFLMPFFKEILQSICYIYSKL